MMRNRMLLMWAALLLVGQPEVRAQADTTFLTLQECIRLARENGPLGAMARSMFESKRSSYRSFTAMLYPQLSLQGEAPGYFRSINPIILPDGSTVYTKLSEALLCLLMF